MPGTDTFKHAVSDAFKFSKNVEGAVRHFGSAYKGLVEKPEPKHILSISVKK